MGSIMVTEIVLIHMLRDKLLFFKVTIPTYPSGKDDIKQKETTKILRFCKLFISGGSSLSGLFLSFSTSNCLIPSSSLGNTYK